MKGPDLDALVSFWQRTADRHAGAVIWRSVSREVDVQVRRRLGLGDRDDLFGSGSVGVVLAMRKFDPTRGMAFRTYVRMHITSEMNAFIDRTLRHRTRTDSLDAPASRGGKQTLHDVIGSGAETQHEALDRRDVATRVRDAVASARQGLTAAQWHVVEGRLIRGRTFDQLATETGKTRQAIHMRAAKAVPHVLERVRAAVEAP